MKSVLFEVQGIGVRGSTDEDGVVVIWDVENRESIRRFFLNPRPETGFIYEAAFVYGTDFVFPVSCMEPVPLLKPVSFVKSVSVKVWGSGIRGSGLDGRGWGCGHVESRHLHQP